MATAFVGAYIEQKWTDRDPRAYLLRIAPYSTTAYLNKLRDSTSDRCDLSCRGAKKGHVLVSADEIETVVPDEAPRTATKVWVQVTYTQRTSWDGGGDSAESGMNLKLVKTGEKWLVDGRTDGGG